jgi:hypothetical protein
MKAYRYRTLKHSFVGIGASAARKGCVGGFALVGVLSIMAEANADTLQPATFYGSVYLDVPIVGTTPFNQTNSTTGPISGSASGPNGASLQGSLGLSSSPSPSISASMTLNGGGSYNGEAINSGGTIQAQINYSLEVLGPSGSATVDVIASGGASVGGTAPSQPDQSLISELSVANTSYGSFEQVGTNGVTTLSPFSWSVDNGITLSTDTVYNVQLTALASSFVPSGTTVDLSAFVDPVFQIDPSTPDASQYSLLLSPDVGNVSATPLPTSFPLFATVLGLMGLVVLRRQRKTQAGLADA